MAVTIHSQEDFIGMRAAGGLAATILDYITPFVKSGVTTEYLDKLCHDKIVENGAIPAPLGYKGFPKSICTSINHVVCHGIPSNKILNEGDIVNIDVTVILDGWHGDTSRMYWVGDKIPIKAQRLTIVTYEAMMKAIEVVAPGVKLNKIGKVIEDYATQQGFSVVRDFCGHGLGKVFHMEPSVLHYFDPKNDMILEEGMFFTIEPMINVGKWQITILPDGWTTVTKDRSLSAQFEHSIGVTKDGYEIFTLSPQGLTHPPYKYDN